jgi:hypothetical protein
MIMKEIAFEVKNYASAEGIVDEIALKRLTTAGGGYICGSYSGATIYLLDRPALAEPQNIGAKVEFRHDENGRESVVLRAVKASDNNFSWIVYWENTGYLRDWDYFSWSEIAGKDASRLNVEFIRVLSEGTPE